MQARNKYYEFRHSMKWFVLSESCICVCVSVALWTCCGPHLTSLVISCSFVWNMLYKMVTEIKSFRDQWIIAGILSQCFFLKVIKIYLMITFVLLDQHKEIIVLVLYVSLSIIWASATNLYFNIIYFWIKKRWDVLNCVHVQNLHCMLHYWLLNLFLVWQSVHRRSWWAPRSLGSVRDRDGKNL